MLTIERTALHHELHAKRLDLQQQDLDRVTNFLESLGTQAALLAGFAFSGIAQLPEGTKPFLVYVFYLSACMTLGSHIYVVCVGQLTAILGPLLALKGPTGSLRRAIDLMKDERHRIFYFFGVGLIGFYLMTVALTWILVKDAWLAAICTAMATILFVTIAARCRRIVARFGFVEPELPTIVLDREFGGGGSGGATRRGHPWFCRGRRRRRRRLRPRCHRARPAPAPALRRVRAVRTRSSGQRQRRVRQDARAPLLRQRGRD